MAWTTPRTWVNAEVVSHTLLNTHVKDNLQYLKDVLDGNQNNNPVIFNTTSTSDVDTLTIRNAGAGGASAKSRITLRRSVDDTVELALRFLNAAGNGGWDIAVPVDDTTLSFTKIGAAEYMRLGQNYIMVPDGVDSTPGITFLNDFNTGLFRVGADIIGFSTGAVERMRLGSTGSLLLTANPSSAIALAFLTDTNTGIGSLASDVFYVFAGGSSVLYVAYNAGNAYLQVDGRAMVGGDMSASVANCSAGTVMLKNATAPTGNPTGGGFLYVESGALKYRGSSGTVTTIANA